MAPIAHELSLARSEGSPMFGFRHHPVQPPQAKPCECLPFHPDIADAENPHVPLSARHFSLRTRSLILLPHRNSPKLFHLHLFFSLLLQVLHSSATVVQSTNSEQRTACCTRVTRFSADLPFIQWHGPTFHGHGCPAKGRDDASTTQSCTLSLSTTPQTDHHSHQKCHAGTVSLP